MGRASMRHNPNDRTEAMKRILPIEREIGRAGRASWLTPADVLYQSILANEAMGRAPQGIYGVFAELEQRDAHFASTLQTRRHALVGSPWQLLWPAPAPQDVERASGIGAAQEHSKQTSPPTQGWRVGRELMAPGKAARSAPPETGATPPFSLCEGVHSLQCVAWASRAAGQEGHGAISAARSCRRGGFGASVVAAAQRHAIAATVQEVISGIENWEQALDHLLDALAYGFALVEVVWRVDRATGHVGVERLVPHAPWEFAFDAQGGLWRLGDGMARRPSSARAASDPVAPPLLWPRPGEVYVSAHGAQRMPERKFLIFVSQPTVERPYGTPLAARVYWYSWFKRQALQDWAQFNANFGSPTPLARYAATTPPSDVDRLTEALERLREQSGLVVPETISVELLESRRASAGASSFRELADWCNDEISKVVLGQTLTTSEGRRSGSLALGRIHEAVRHDYLVADARALGQVLTRQLVRWIVDFNFGTEAPAPEFVFDVEEPLDDKAELEVDRGLVQLGVPLDVAYFYRKYRRPAPSPEARQLKYDDANFYQYHLQYGVLTINEVRAALGLAPVAWGDRPPVKLAPAQSAEADATTLKEPLIDQLEGRRDTLSH